MMDKIKAIFKGKKNKRISDYSGMSDFLMHAPEDAKREVFMKAARLANEDQMRTFDKARLKVEAN